MIDPEFDLLESFAKLPKGAQQLFNHIRSHADNAGICVFPKVDSNDKSVYNQRQRALMQLRKENMCHHLPEGERYLLHVQTYERECCYVINPCLIKYSDSQRALKAWYIARRAYTGTFNPGVTYDPSI